MTAPLLPTQARENRAAPLLCCAGIAAAVLAAYGRGIGGSFLYDDLESVAGNASIRHFATALFPPYGTTVSGRPVLNLSFAVNYAVSGPRVWSYHALNIAIHAAAALLLFGIVRRTLWTRAAGGWGAPSALRAAFAAALLWALHPLQTESVAYVVQRAESLMGFFYLLTLYAFIRMTEGAGGRLPWGGLAFAACLLGMATKEVMVTAPVVVLLYDRVFVGGSFAEAWRRRRAVHSALAFCWVPLAALVLGTGGRAGTAGPGSGVAWWAYLLTQFRAVPHYLRLSLWPHPLVGDYGRILEGRPVEAALGAVLVACLAAASWFLLRRRPAIGFLGAFFLIILAPSSSFIPVSTELIAEHRMYLPLAAVAVFAVLALRAVLGCGSLFLASAGVLAAALGISTAMRVPVYGSPAAFWCDVTVKAPANAGAWNNLGAVRAEAGDQAGAIADYRRALALAPEFSSAHFNLGNSLISTGRPRQAQEQFEEALKYRPGDPAVHRRLAAALALENRGLAAAAQFREAIRLDPASAESWAGLGAAMVQVGNLTEAASAYQQAVRLRPDRASSRVDYGDVLAQLNRVAEGIAEYREALRLEPGVAEVHNNLGGLLAESGELAEARAEFEEALRLKPGYADARDNLERVRILEGGQAGVRR